MSLFQPTLIPLDVVMTYRSGDAESVGYFGSDWIEEIGPCKRGLCECAEVGGRYCSSSGYGRERERELYLELMASLTEHGQADPIEVIEYAGGIRSVSNGHHRIFAALELGWSTIGAEIIDRRHRPPLTIHSPRPI